ncbi:uncharacterized protein LOC116851174 [Odontomachus brunneus]|uniref:uncharacterized protein LOC116851174 n=1 Tax=Odontomachus brunneus TaxID=486640 RepID=UPI0013F2888D|nr:uncharacterized protein LOC116851174 [Odontomachus brunneus]XP_032686230.1 uncharacterized protein LOC116851174 [Odontomachus brunneus]XP_032686236.1 uncharacterized protein LOC116851174 [Odontomachus brunneus]XP_032686246.1 uncharacterized protein LOC116851174 [Odontomachus brunneus]XP_032686253.1 uncharacterized protein LOC116851174 [Odontomachus brunneus]
MANKVETTFGTLETDERYKKLERCLKLALLKEKHNKNVHNTVEQSISSWPSISSINADTINSNCITPSIQALRIDSKILASSNNLRCMLSKKKDYDINKKIIATSSVKQYSAKQDNYIDQCKIMPPPSVNRVYHTSKRRQNNVDILSEGEKLASTPLNSSIQPSVINSDTFAFKNSKINTSYISASTNNDEEYLHSLVTPAKDLPKSIERVFSKWKVMLNAEHQLIIKGTLKCGKVARSKPVIRRYSATCVESIFKHQYHLQGSINDEKNELPDYIRGKFYNGFPDDWENVYQIWRTFVNEGCLVTFRWPTPITDSDDDLKSEMTDLTYVCRTRNKSNTLLRSYETIEPAKQVIQPKSQGNKSSEKVKTYNSMQSTKSYGENCTFVKSFVSDAENDRSLAAQASNVSNELNKQNIKTNVNQPHSPKKKNKLKDFLQEDKLSIIINNLADKNCSTKYIDKIIEMFDCLDYVMSYRTKTESDFNMVSENCNTSKSEENSLQVLLCNKDNNIDDNNHEKRTEPKSQMHSSDLGYGNIKNDIDPNQLRSHVKDSVKQEHEDFDKSESEIYAGVPKISIERVLQAREAMRKFPRRKVRKKATQLDQQMHAANEQHNANVKHNFTVHTTLPTSNAEKKNLLPDESCVSITEEEMEAPEITRTHHRVANIVHKPQETTFSSHQLQRTDSVIRTEKTAAPATRMQRNEPFFLDRLNFIQPQRIKPNIFTKKQNSREVQEKRQLQFTDVDYTTNSDVEKDVATATNVCKTRESNGAESHANLRQDAAVVHGENGNDFLEKARVSQEFVELPKVKDAVTRSKPTIVSAIPVNINLRLTKADVHRSAKSHDSDVSIIDTHEQRANVRSMEETPKKKPAPVSKTSTITEPAFIPNELPLSTTVNIEKENDAASSIAKNAKKESDNTSPTKSKTIVTKRSNKQVDENNPKMLTAWAPKVVYHPTFKTELGLTFQGKLLNEAGHIVHRNFTTDIVLRRLSPTLVETVNHEFYQLLGPLSDNKHVISKELVKQCRHGCPAKIEQFCLAWKLLQHGEVEVVEEKPHDITTTSLSVPVSSRGRKILPPLSYWTGERVTLKDNIPVYSLGNSKKSSLTSLSPNKKQEINPKDASKNNVTKQKPLPDTNEIFNTNKNQVTSTKLPKAADNVKKFRKSTVNGKRKVSQQLTFSSSDSDFEEERKMSPHKRLRNSQSNTDKDAKVQSKCTMTLRKRQKVEIPLNRISHENTNTSRNNATHCIPTRKSYRHNIMYTYCEGIPREDLLSEDQISLI